MNGLHTRYTYTRYPISKLVHFTGPREWLEDSQQSQKELGSQSLVSPILHFRFDSSTMPGRLKELVLEIEALAKELTEGLIE